MSDWIVVPRRRQGSSQETMNVLILGDGIEERAWADWLSAHPEHRLEALFPGFAGADFGDSHVAGDLDEALATAGIDLAIVGGPLEFRSEALRRAAAEGLAIVCLHPPGADSEAYYQVALSRSETGAVVVPDLPLRLHPGVARLRQAIATAELGTLRGIRHECPANPAGGDLARTAFPRIVDVVRALMGEVEALTASGDPPGERPDIELVVQLRGTQGRKAEVRTWTGPAEPARLGVNGSEGSLTLEYDPSFREPARLIHRAGPRGGEQIEDLEPWDSYAAIMETLLGCLESRGQQSVTEPGPNLNDGTRAMELSEAAVRSLRRGRTIDLHYEAISEDSSFKSIMTSTGCMILMAALLILPLALAGSALGINWTIYLAYFIPPVLVVFAVLQVLRFGIRKDE
jgi:myo-inositol 2-dehydrogenase/D-chiro-inositol 1-dehydrogenase